MNRCNEDEYLYHYTSIEKLALILKNRTIRLNSLDQMDDLQEQRTADVNGLGKFTFVSCWTSESIESIPMWNMYTPLTSGVRIKMRKRPFVHYDNIPAKRLRECVERKNGGNYSNHNCMTDVYIDGQWMIDNDVITPHAFGDDILYKIDYVDDIEKLEPKVAEIKNGQVNLVISELGKYKNKHWDFQKEWRYLLAVFPYPLSQSDDRQFYINVTVSLLLEGRLQPPFRFIDLLIDDDYFSEMEITCSPKMTSGNRILLESLVREYNPSAIIKESSLKNLI